MMYSINPKNYIGRDFFYADEETGIGWTSKIDGVFRKESVTGYCLELSCGTRVDISYRDLVNSKNEPFVTNLKG